LYCTKSSWGCICCFPPTLAENLHNPPPNGKQGPIHEEIYQTLLTNKKQGNLGKVHDANIIKPTQTPINHKKYTFCVRKSLEHLKNLKTGCVLYLGLELTMHVLKSQIHLVGDSPFTELNVYSYFVLRLVNIVQRISLQACK
jgi:hypothetical protein